MAASFSISFGVAAVLGAIFAYAATPHMDPTLAFGGVVLFVGTAAVAAFAYSGAAEALVARETNKPLRPDPRARTSAPVRIGPGRAIILSVTAGIFMGLSEPLLNWAREGENGIAPYGVAILFGVGLFVCALVAVPFFINFPVQGVAITPGTYFKGTMMQHIFGIFAGIVWGVGALAAWVSVGAPASVQAGPALTYVFLEGSAVLAAIWGLLVWKDLAWSSRSRTYTGGALVLFLIGVGMVSVAYLK
jgi:glucose uptake protein